MGRLASIRQRLRRLLIPPRLVTDLHAIRMSQGRILTELNRAKPAQPIRECEFGIFSQWGEDGVIQKLIQAVPIAHRTFIEFGVEDFSESNCRYLLLNDHWRGYVLDGSEKWIRAITSVDSWWKHHLQARCALVTRENVNALLLESGFEEDLGILSVDVDGVDYWLLEAITAFRPRILIVEYNSLFGSERAITVPYDEHFTRRSKHYSDLYFGASLSALTSLASTKGYSLVGVESAGVNAFFVRNDVMGDLSALSIDQAFVHSHVRQSRDREGKLDYLTPDQSREVIRGLPVVNVLTGAIEPF